MLIDLFSTIEQRQDLLLKQVLPFDYIVLSVFKFLKLGDFTLAACGDDIFRRKLYHFNRGFLIGDFLISIAFLLFSFPFITF